MKKYILGLIIFATFNLPAQSYISQTQINIISYSVTINYNNGGTYNYQPKHYGSLRTRQARYDYYHNMINTAWKAIKNANFINNKNRFYLAKKNSYVENDMRENNQYKHVDLSVNGDFANSYSEWITDVFNIPSVKAEVKLLKAVYSEYYRLKNNYPNDFHLRDRYKELLYALDELVDCSPDKIGEISIRYGLW